MLAACEDEPLPARHSFGAMVRRHGSARWFGAMVRRHGSAPWFGAIASRLVVPFRARYFAAVGERDMISTNFGAAKRGAREKQRGSFCDA